MPLPSVFPQFRLSGNDVLHNGEGSAKVVSSLGTVGESSRDGRSFRDDYLAPIGCAKIGVQAIAPGAPGLVARTLVEAQAAELHYDLALSFLITPGEDPVICLLGSKPGFRSMRV